MFAVVVFDANTNMVVPLRISQTGTVERFDYIVFAHLFLSIPVGLDSLVLALVAHSNESTYGKSSGSSAYL